MEKGTNHEQGNGDNCVRGDGASLADRDRGDGFGNGAGGRQLVGTLLGNRRDEIVRALTRDREVNNMRSKRLFPLGINAVILFACHLFNADLNVVL
jgi:hypothetical protein